jgi:hypothetical protein
MIRRSCRGPSGVFKSQNAKPFLLGTAATKPFGAKSASIFVPKDVDQDEARVEMSVKDHYETIGTGMNHSGSVV